MLPPILSLALLAAPARAGDPCPIDFRLSNLGPLPKEGAVDPGHDAIFQALAARLAQADCTALTVVVADGGTLSLGKAPEGLQAWRLQELLVDDKGAFRCEDAHQVLVALSAVNESGHVVYQRGTRRVLLAAAGWQTVCMDVATLEAGGDAALDQLWQGATGRLVQWRHDNP